MDWNKNLITLKCVLFLFFGALGSVLPFLPLHMSSKGLSKDESVIVSAVAPLIAILGPLIAAPLADRLAGGFGGSPRSKTGTYLRVMVSVCAVMATLFYWLLLLVPVIKRSPPAVSFMCDEQGGFILQDRCGAERTCYNWGTSKGSVFVKNCQFTCNATVTYTGEITTIIPEEIEDDDDDYYGSEGGSSGPIVEPEIGFGPAVISNTPGHTGIIPHPHMCYKNSSGGQVCEVYTEFSKPIHFHLGLTPSVTGDGNDTEDEICKYAFADPFSCRIPPEVHQNLTHTDDSCHPLIQCEVHEPYNGTESLLRRSQCGYDSASFWLYLVARSLADAFAAAAVALLATAVVIATRETSTGRGDVGKQYAAAALGFGLGAIIIGGVGGELFSGMISMTVCVIVAVIVLLADRSMPLSPPEWWWHTRCGLLALPMSSVRKYGLETGAVALVLFLLGVFWNAIDSFLPWHAVNLKDGEPLIIGSTVAISAIPAVIYLIFAEVIVDYCGHSNILIFCFINYICHHLALAFIENAKLLLICEYLEVFTLHIMYITAVLYLRHLVPRKLTACAQALPIIAHFCLGRCVGAILGGIAYSNPTNFQTVHMHFTVAAAVVATLYLLCYHFYLKPKCAAPVHLPPDPAPALVQSANGNGSYTPLRVYHNSKSKKGHFRY